MTAANSSDYHAEREAQERAAAAAALDPTIRAIHLDFAARYAALKKNVANGATEPPMSDIFPQAVRP